MALTLELKPGEVLQVGGVEIRYEYKSGHVVRLHVDAPREIPVRKNTVQKDQQAVPTFVPIMRKTAP